MRPHRKGLVARPGHPPGGAIDRECAPAIGCGRRFSLGLLPSDLRLGPHPRHGRRRALGRPARRARRCGCCRSRSRWSWPSAARWGFSAFPLPGVELGIAVSAIVLGTMVLLEARPRLIVAAVIVGVFAIFHGHAHGTELPPGQDGLLYSLGFVVATGCLHGVGIAIGTVHPGRAGASRSGSPAVSWRSPESTFSRGCWREPRKEDFGGRGIPVASFEPACGSAPRHHGSRSLLRRRRSPREVSGRPGARRRPDAARGHARRLFRANDSRPASGRVACRRLCRPVSPDRGQPRVGRGAVLSFRGSSRGGRPAAVASGRRRDLRRHRRVPGLPDRLRVRAQRRPPACSSWEASRPSSSS